MSKEIVIFIVKFNLDHTAEDLAQKDTELTAGLGVAIGLMAIELVSISNIKTRTVTLKNKTWRRGGGD